MRFDANVLKISGLFVIWRLILFAVAFISPFIIPTFGDRFPYHEKLINSKLPHFIWSFGNFDGVHYLGIADERYTNDFTQAFFPLYPILTRFSSELIFGNVRFTNLIISAILISNVAFLFAIFIFYKLVKGKYNEKTALWSCLFLLFFPTSYYFGAIYTEGFFFLMIIGSFYLLSKNKVILSSIVGSFASATRLAGLFLAPAQAIGRKSINRLIPILIIPVGFLLYVYYLKLKFNNPLYFLSSQTVFGQERSTNQIVLLPQVIWRYCKILATTNGLTFANAAFELLSTIFALFILFVAYKKKFKGEWLVFSFLAVLVPTLTGTLASMPRYILVAFPIYIVLAQIKSTQFKVIILIIFTLLLFATTTLFTQGYWVA